MSGVLAAGLLAALAVLVRSPPVRRGGRPGADGAPGGGAPSGDGSPVGRRPQRWRRPERAGSGRSSGTDQGSPRGPSRGSESTRGDPQSRRSHQAAALVAGVSVAWLTGSAVGVVVGGAVAVAVLVGLGRLEPAAARRERLAVAAAAPIAADLLAAALAAGVPVEAALPVVAEAVGGPLARRLQHVDRLVRLGVEPADAWAIWQSDECLQPLAAAVTRSARTGAPLATLLELAARDLRLRARAQARAQIRAASVRAVLPLGLCLLPAFFLLGVVPIVGGLLADLL